MRSDFSDSGRRNHEQHPSSSFSGLNPHHCNSWCPDQTAKDTSSTYLWHKVFGDVCLRMIPLWKRLLFIVLVGVEKGRQQTPNYTCSFWTKRKSNQTTFQIIWDVRLPLARRSWKFKIFIFLIIPPKLNSFHFLVQMPEQKVMVIRLEVLFLWSLSQGGSIEQNGSPSENQQAIQTWMFCLWKSQPSGDKYVRVSLSVLRGYRSP